jgi:SPP1 gp7 family putative phage head morphogenesis protein
LAINEELTAIEAQHGVYIQRLAAQFGNESKPFIDSMSERITDRINREVGKNLTPNRRKKLLSDINDIVNEELKGYTDSLAKNDADLGKYEADFQAKTLTSLYESTEAVAISKSVINSNAKNTLIKLGDDSYTGYTQMLNNYVRQNREQINNIVEQGFVSGTTTREIANQVLTEVDNRVVKTRKQAMNIARTGTNHYANSARETYFSEEPIIIGTRRIATLDSRTSQYCRGIDNTVVLKTDPNYRKAFAPFHPNCRTANIPEVDARYKHEDDGGERPENFRNVDSGLLEPGVTDSKKTYYEAIKGLDAASQDAILGPTLGRAFRKGIKEGSITPDSFARMTIDEKNLRPLTLTEMQKKDNELGRIIRSVK